MRSYEEIRNSICAGLGMVSCDTVLKNVKLVNVFSSEIIPTNIYIKNGRVISIDPTAELTANEQIDCKGMYAVPGFIDAHMHFESTMLSPEALANIVVPQGTTTLCADLMEIANVAGAPGLRTMLESADKLPCRFLVEVSSRVPTAPGLETTGAVLGRKEVSEIMKWPESISLGELDPAKILMVKDEYIHKVADTLNLRKVVNGHAIGRLGQELNVYASAGISDDHECVTAEEMISRLRVGMKVFIREGSTERNLDTLLTAALKHRCPLENLAFCTDDKHANEIRTEGHINYNVRRAIQLGADPIDAIKMATINTAKHFRMEDEIGSITPGRLADILLMKDLCSIQPEMVFFEGKLVSKGRNLLVPCTVHDYPEWIKDTVILKKPVTAASFRISSKKEQGTAKVNIIELIDLQIINKRITDTLSVAGHEILPDASRNILKLAVVERYGKNGNIGIGFVKGFALKRGALAYSMSHDHHNIVVVGVNDEDMAVAVNTVAELRGGLCVVSDGVVTASMPLPIGGLMSEKSAEDVMSTLDTLNAAARENGCTLPAPFMTLSFISLPTVPELGLTDLGLIDVIAQKQLPVEIEE